MIFMANINKKNTKGKGEMQNNTKIMIALAIVVVIIAIASLIVPHSKTNKTTSLISSPATLNSAGTGAVGPVKLANSQYASYAYLIYPNSSNKYVAAGFNITVNNLNNGSVKVTIAALGNTGSNTNFTFPANYELYYIDQSIGDDAPPSSDYVAADDHVVLVNSSGYIVGNIISP